MPLKVRGQIIGVLYVDNKARNALFGQGDLDLLNAFAGQAAVAIENSRLYTHTDQALAARVAELQTMQTIDRQLNAAALDLIRCWKSRSIGPCGAPRPSAAGSACTTSPRPACAWRPAAA